MRFPIALREVQAWTSSAAARRPRSRVRRTYFTGNVTIEWQVARPEPSRLAAALVSFQPGAADRQRGQLPKP